MYLIDYQYINYNNTALACYPLASPFCTPWGYKNFEPTAKTIKRNAPFALLPSRQ